MLALYRVLPEVQVRHVTEVEGVIQFRYERTPGECGVKPVEFGKLQGWRAVLRDLGLLGEDPARYGGYGFGNMSIRLTDDRFAVTASQTSGAPALEPAHLTRIDETDLDGFAVRCTGSLPPSSESLTHAMIYRADDQCRVVFHVHSPVIWSHRDHLGLPSTPAAVPYGTPAMAGAVGDLLASWHERPVVFATAGHEDGVFVAGATPDACGERLVACLAAARALALAPEGLRHR